MEGVAQPALASEVEPRSGLAVCGAPQYRIEPFSSWMREGVPLFEAHWLEIGRHRDKILLKPAFDRFVALEKAGVLHSMTARIGDGSLIGYAVFMVMPHLHYADDVFAYNDMVYLQRKRGYALGFIRFCEQVLRTRGVSKITYHVKVSKDFGPLLIRMGYEAAETLYEKLVL